jgi:hypothetical protein
MKLRTRYPALISGRVKRMLSDRQVLCLPEDEFEVRGITSADAPVALIVTQYETRTEFRLHDGVLYTLLPEMPSKLAGDTEYNPLAALLNRGHPLFGDMATEIYDTVYQREANETRPDKLHGILTSRIIPRDVVDLAVSNARDIVETEMSRASIELWRAKARQRFSQIILINGQHWQRAAEPAYKLNLFSGHAEAQHSDVYDNGTQYRKWSEYEWEILTNRYFSPFDVDAMREAALKLGDEGRNELVLNGTIDVLLPEALKHDYADLELDRAARVCVRKIERQLNRVARRQQEELRSFPREPMMAACQLRDALAYRTPYDEVDDSLASALETFIDALDKHPQLASDMDFSDEVPSLRDILDGWCSRDAAPTQALLAVRSPTV